MEIPQPLVKGRLLKRYKRFLADVEIDKGTTVTAHCANPGSMLGLVKTGAEVWLSKAPKGSKRKLTYSWELIRLEETLVGINTLNANKIMAEAIQARVIPELAGYDSVRREVRYGTNSRIDFLLEAPGKPACYLEVKNVHLRRNDLAEFPDSITKRGAKHLGELIKIVQAGMRAVLFYVVQREDCKSFALAADIDKDYAQVARKAVSAGVEVMCYGCTVTTKDITLTEPLTIRN